MVSTDTKRRLRWSSRALWQWEAPTHLKPRFGTGLLFKWSGEAGNRQRPAQLTTRYPTLGSSWDGGDTTRLRHGLQQTAPWKKHRGVPRLHMLQMVNKPCLHLLLQKHFGGLELLLSTSMVLKCHKRCSTRQAALLQVHCAPYGDAETGPEPGPDPANSHDC